MRNIDLIVGHCSATAIDESYTVEQLERDHKNRNFSAIGYHYYIRRDGTIHKCRPLEKIGAHAKGHNTGSVAWCYEGGIIAGGRANIASHAKDTRTEAQKKSIKEVIKEIYNFFGDYQDMSEVKILGHRDLSPDLDGNGKITPNEYMKQCPCYDVESENYESLINKS